MLFEVEACGQRLERVDAFEIPVTSRLAPFFADHFHLIDPDAKVIGQRVPLCEPPVDLLAVHPDGSLLVCDLQLPDRPNELRALHWVQAARNLSFEVAAEHYCARCKQEGWAGDGRKRLREFLDVGTDEFARDVRIVLAGLGLTTELRASLTFLRDSGVDIRYIRLQAYLIDGDRIFAHVERQLPPVDAAPPEPLETFVPTGNRILDLAFSLADPPSSRNPFILPER